MTLRLGAETVRAHPLARIVGVTGLVGTVLLFAALIAGSPGEPPPDATTAEAAEFVRGLDATWVRLAEVVGDIGCLSCSGSWRALPPLAPSRGRRPPVVDDGHAVRRAGRCVCDP